MGGASIEVTVLWFAGLRERRGASEERLRLQAGTTVGSLFSELVGTGTVAFVVGRRRVGPDTLLADGDEVAFLPPLGGG